MFRRRIPDEERFFQADTSPVLMLRAECSRFTLKPAHLSPYLPSSGHPLISVDTRVEREKIHIFYDQQEVKDTSLVLLKVCSTGTEDVRIYRRDEIPSDSFETPYWFIFEGRTVVARSILETDPANFIKKHEVETYNQTPDPRTNAVSLPHCLLKSKRSFTLRILMTGPKGEIKTEGQLVDCELEQFIQTTDDIKVKIMKSVICHDICPLRALYGSKGQRTFYGKKSQCKFIQV